MLISPWVQNDNFEENFKEIIKHIINICQRSNIDILNKARLAQISRLVFIL